MKKNTKEQHLRWLVAPGLVALLVVPGLTTLAADKKKKSQAQAAPQEELVWPLPPSPPRIRWVTQIAKFSDLQEKKKKKRSWFERVAGVKESVEREMSLSRPYGVAADSRGRIFVADTAYRVVIVFDLNARRVEVRRPSRRAPLVLPLGVAVDEQDRLFVSDAVGANVTCFDPEGVPLAQFGRDELERPAGLALDKKRHLLYVADPKANRVAVFNSQTFALVKYIGAPSTRAREEGKFSAPTNLAVDGRGRLYVTDTFNHRIQIFNRRGRFERAFGTHGDTPGSFARPKGIAVDSQGHIYVADGEFNNFQVFDQQGRPLMFVGSFGNEPGQFTLLSGLFIDEQDRIYATDLGRMQIFQFISQPETVAAKEVNRRNP